jgi:hypothetical protein
MSTLPSLHDLAFHIAPRTWKIDVGGETYTSICIIIQLQMLL